MLNRRETLRVVAGAAAALWVGNGFLNRSRGAIPGQTPVLTPEEEQGPFYIPDERIRHDITEGKPGVPLDLQIALVQAANGQPLAGAAVDIWHCDAGGIYSGFAEMKMGPPPGGGDGFEMFDDGPPGPPPGGGGGKEHLNAPTNKFTFLRGVQLTDAKGIASFSTLYPGWYAGREIHIHLKVHVDGQAAKDGYAGGHVCHTGQLFFPDETNAVVSMHAPYALSKTVRTTKETDHVYREQNGSLSVMMVRPVSDQPAAGYRASVTLAIDPHSTPPPVGMR